MILSLETKTNLGVVKVEHSLGHFFQGLDITAFFHVWLNVQSSIYKPPNIREVGPKTRHKYR